MLFPRVIFTIAAFHLPRYSSHPSHSPCIGCESMPPRISKLYTHENHHLQPENTPQQPPRTVRIAHLQLRPRSGEDTLHVVAICTV